MPLYNWIKCSRGDLKYVRIDIKKGQEVGEEEKIVWEKIYSNYIDEFGLGKLQKKIIKVSKEKALLEIDYVLTGNRFRLTEIALEEQRLKEIVENNNKGMSTEQSLVYLSKWLGYHVNSKKISVREYFDIITEYGKQNKTE